MNLSAAEIITYITQTKPYLIVEVLRLAKPYMQAIEERAQATSYGTVALTMTVRAGEVEKIEFDEKHTWLRQKESKTT